jgi:lysine biosynthesis protein LysW
MIECVVCGAKLNLKETKKGKTVVCPDCSVKMELIGDTLVMLRLEKSKHKRPHN